MADTSFTVPPDGYNWRNNGRKALEFGEGVCHYYLVRLTPLSAYDHLRLHVMSLTLNLSHSVNTKDAVLSERYGIRRVDR